MSFFTGQHLHQQLEALPRQSEGWFPVSSREERSKDGHMGIDNCISLQGTLLLFIKKKYIFLRILFIYLSIYFSIYLFIYY